MNDETNSFESTMATIEALKHQIASSVIGQQQVVHEAVVCVIAAGHALIEGVPGLGKTLLVKSIAKACGAEFNRIQFTPDLMPADVTGHKMFDTQKQQWVVHRGPVFCHFLLADEVNRAPAKTQSSLLEVMQEHQVTIEGDTLALEEPFIVLATQNPIEQEGTYPLPEAQLDRFLLKIKIDYPTLEEEISIANQMTNGQVGDKLDTSSIEAVMNPSQVVAMQNIAANIQLDASIVDYAVRVATATRSWNGIDTGASPRASLALLRAARASALIHGLSFVTPDDIKAIAPAVLRHRLRLTADYEIEGISIDEVINEVLGAIDAPRQ